MVQWQPCLKVHGDEVKDCKTSGMPSPMAPLLPRVSGTCRYASIWFLPPWWLSSLVSRRCFFFKDAPPDTGTGHFCKLNLNPANWELLMSQCQEPRIELLLLWRKGNWETQTSWWCLETDLKTLAKIWPLLPTHLDKALSRISWMIVSSSCPSEAAITPPPELCTETNVSITAVLVWEFSCSMVKVI